MPTKKDLKEYLLVIADLADELGYAGITSTMRGYIEGIESGTTLDSTITALNLPGWVRNALHKKSIFYVGQLVQFKKWQVLQIPEIGHGSLADIQAALAKIGYQLETVTDWTPPAR